MVTLVLGGAGSGKSEIAEKLVSSYGNRNLIYIATMMIYDDESKDKVRRHKEMRKSKKFTSVIECYKNLSEVEASYDSDILIDCISNLLANEMFTEGQVTRQDIVLKKIVNGVKKLAKSSKNLVIVSNDIFSDGINYDKTTIDYIKALAVINSEISKLSDNVIEVVYGIPVILKGKGVL